MKPYIIPVFIDHGGCPNRCVYCNERITAGTYRPCATFEDFSARIEPLLPDPQDPRPLQIAFYGGNFTGLQEERQTRLLEFASRYIDAGHVRSIRISTRPDYIDDAVAERLHRFGVDTVELGAQSMDDRVLRIAERGHSSADTKRAIKALRKRGILTGLHLMAGLPGDTDEGFLATVDEAVELKPDSVRIHPTIVLRDTRLAEFHAKGTYRPLTMTEASTLCKEALRRFHTAGIPVIRMGLQTTRELETDGNVVAGPFHPSFGSIVMSSLFLDAVSDVMAQLASSSAKITVTVNPRDGSDCRGLRNENIHILKDRFFLDDILIREKASLSRHAIIVERGGLSAERHIFDLCGTTERREKA